MASCETVDCRGGFASQLRSSVIADKAPLPTEAVYESGLPVLGICYGEQAMCAQLGGAVEASDHREFGRADL
ncbi:MAG: gamma-glutamyl-gamma-aminobutyrate hydrolase family protein, partial [Actinomycetota bacterium]